MDPTLTWLLVLAAAVLIVFGAVRFDVLALRWRDAIQPRPPAPRDAPPAPRRAPVEVAHPHASPAYKTAIHRSGKRH